MLELMDVCKSYLPNQTMVLKNINLRIPQGECCIIIGNNGSGKSTLMRCLAGDEKIDRGQIFFHGKLMDGGLPSHLVATVIQDPNQGTVADMTVLENMALSAKRGQSAKLRTYRRNKSAILLWIQSLGIGLERFLDQPVKFLSGGQRQMIAVLMAIQSHPSLLLLDEHTSALDPKTQRMLMDYTISAVKKYQMTCVMVTHRLDDALRYGDRLFMMHEGQFVMEYDKEQKKTLDMETLLNLFHHYQDLSLTYTVNSPHVG